MGSTYQARAATEADLPALVDLHVACDVAETGEPETDADNVQAMWRVDGFDRAMDTLVIFDGDRAVGYGAVLGIAEHDEFEGETRAHPSLPDDDVELALLDFVESRTAVLAQGGDAVLGVFADASNRRKCALLDEAGYRPQRYFWRMGIDLTGSLGAPQWPSGITPRTFETGDERAVHALHQEAFAQHWHHRPSSFDSWVARSMRRSGFDPRLWTLAEVGGDLVGAQLGYSFDDVAWVGALAVSPRSRGRGLGMALLRDAFQRFAEVGYTRAELEVDAGNTTGATRLYERAGMTVTRRHVYMARSLATKPRAV